MRTSLPIQASIRRFVVWRIAVAAVALLALGSVVAWLVAVDQPVLIRAALFSAGLAAIVYATGWLLLIPTRPTDLRWDGARWLVASAGAATRDAVPAEVEVALDLGSWMLLRLCIEEASGARPRVVWLPAERAALGADWHPLRCAVHGAARGQGGSADSGGMPS